RRSATRSFITARRKSISSRSILPRHVILSVSAWIRYIAADTEKRSGGSSWTREMASFDIVQPFLPPGCRKISPSLLLRHNCDVGLRCRLPDQLGGLWRGAIGDVSRVQSTGCRCALKLDSTRDLTILATWLRTTRRINPRRMAP